MLKSLAAGAPAPTSPSGQTVVEFVDVQKHFGQIAALSGVSFAGHAGSVHAVTGENGAGKSTLMKMLAGVHAPDAGEIRLGGSPMRVTSALEARAAGIATVFQELTLLPNLTIAQNLFLGREPRRLGFVDGAAMRRMAREALDRVGLDLSVDLPCGDLTIGEQHMVEIAKGAQAQSRVIIYDEPTAAIDAESVRKLVQLIAQQKASGKLIFYISHRLEEIFELCDTTTVLKDGMHVWTGPTAELTRGSLVSLMVGREVGQIYPQRPAAKDSAAALSIEGLVPKHGMPAASFELRRGEILGLAGLEGQGQRDIIRCIGGLQDPTAGHVARHEPKETSQPPQTLPADVVAVVRAGVGFIPEDRKTEGLYLPLSIEENIGLGMLRRSGLAMRARIDSSRLASLIRDMNVRARDERQAVSSLSGGNQQKVMIGRWLASGIDILLIEEPTRGVDVGAKAEIYRLLREFADAGGAVLLTSSELTEHLGLCDRLLVVRRGAIVAQLPAAEASEETVMHYALLGNDQQEVAA
ncbi:sugar ABC transporter ATP-binding protein [Paraburkholderia sp. UYCP14C]|uniref:sugar ABC transporter ATP-binding protein n=1 Tax=Paraburkholderia sp. UYCP14C TaxID=2511130 RepID=UPI001021E7D2|nr:sugar ABC transporter ATP-binding protein [Paraburkholderia sp. UYCP14C]RZF29782.1 sugar ABC transporter ATP-binding protein [Paraburkholderia sp. UYCP14C]